MTAIERFALFVLTFVALVHGVDAQQFRGSSSGGGSPRTPLALTRAINVSGSTSTTAFAAFAQPFQPGEVPNGNIVTAAIGGTNVPITCGARKLHHGGGVPKDLSLDWAQCIADLSGISYSGATLTLSTTAGSWPGASGLTDAGWIALGDTVQLTNMSTTSTNGTDMAPAGTTTCSFDGGADNTIEVYMDGPQGRWVSVTADCSNGGVTNAYLRARMEYIETKLAGGGAGPIASRGPFMENVQILKSNLAGNVNPGEFDYDIAWLRGGSPFARTDGNTTEHGVKHIALSRVPLCRADGGWDWTANDPNITWVGWDYTVARKTLKIPPFIDGITYSGPDGTASVTSVVGGTFTVASTGAIFGPGITQVKAVEFTAKSEPTGITAGVVYWAVYGSATTFTLYDTLADATAAGSTGKINASGGTGVLVEIAIAPNSAALFEQRMGNPGTRPDLNLLTEWGAAYLVGNSAKYARLGRVMATLFSGIPFQALDAITHKIPSLLDAAGTPSGMTDYLIGGQPTTFWGIGTGNSSSNINSGNGATGGLNNWGNQGEPDHFTGQIVYAVWVMEGGTILRDMMLADGDRAVNDVTYMPKRNASIGGTTYYGNFMLQNGLNARNIAWSLRDASVARFVAAEGSPEETYFTNVLVGPGGTTGNMGAASAYSTFNGTNFTNLGLFWYSQQDLPPATHAQGSGAVEGFMQSYLELATAWPAVALNGDAISALGTFANQVAAWPIGLYDSSFCSYFATSYTWGGGLSDFNAASPGSYPSSNSHVGLGPGANMIFNYTSGSADISYASGQTPAWALAVGDKFIPHNWQSLGSAAVPAAPSPLSDGIEYFIVSVNAGAKTFQVSATSGGTALVAGATVSGSGGVFIAAGQSCPSTGSISGDANSADGYLAWQRAAIASNAALVGSINAGAAYTNANARFTGNFNTQAGWGFGGRL